MPLHHRELALSGVTARVLHMGTQNNDNSSTTSCVCQNKAFKKRALHPLGSQRAVTQQGTGGTWTLPSLAEATALKMSNEVPSGDPDENMRWAFSGVGGQ